MANPKQRYGWSGPPPRTLNRWQSSRLLLPGEEVAEISDIGALLLGDGRVHLQPVDHPLLDGVVIGE